MTTKSTLARNAWERMLQQVSDERGGSEKLLASIARHAEIDLIQDLHLAHARYRESVVIGVNMTIRIGALLLSAPLERRGPLIKGAGLTDDIAAGSMQMCRVNPQVSAYCLRRRSRISEALALRLLDQEKLPSHPFATQAEP